MGIGPEWIVVIGVLVLVFGASQLPKLAKSLGQAKAEFEKGQRGEGDDAAADKDAPAKSDAPAKPETANKSADTSDAPSDKTAD